MFASISTQQQAGALDQIIRFTNELGGVTSGVATGLQSSIKVQVAESFEGTMDSNSVVNFKDAMHQYFDLVGLNDEAWRSKLNQSLYKGPQKQWFTVQRYANLSNPQTWTRLKMDLFNAFRLDDFERLARTQLYNMKKIQDDVTNYIAEFCVNFNRCSSIGEPEAIFIFESGLQLEIRQQVLGFSIGNEHKFLRQSPRARDELQAKRAVREQQKDFVKKTCARSLITCVKCAPPDMSDQCYTVVSV